MNVTPLMGLPYPNGLDAPCDFDDDWCAFTSALDEVFTKFESGLQRSYPAIPIAILQITAPITILNFNPIPFDTVTVDTANMTDLDADPYAIVIPKSARYTAAAALRQNPSGGTNIQSVLTIANANVANGGIDNTINDRGAGATVYYNNVFFPVFDALEGDRITLTTFVSGFPTRTAVNGWLAIYWHSDTERP